MSLRIDRIQVPSTVVQIKPRTDSTMLYMVKAETAGAIVVGTDNHILPGSNNGASISTMEWTYLLVDGGTELWVGAGTAEEVAIISLAAPLLDTVERIEKMVRTVIDMISCWRR